MKDEMDWFGQYFGWDEMETAYWRAKHQIGRNRMEDDFTKLLIGLAGKVKKEENA